MAEHHDCIFCKIIKKEIPSAKVIDNGKIIAFLDIQPVNKGHVLVVPKEHFETMLDIPEAVLKDMILAAKRIARSMRKSIKADGFNIGMNNFTAAGQAVMHAHMHIIPRFDNDGLQHWPGKKYEEGEMDKIREAIISLL